MKRVQIELITKYYDHLVWDFENRTWKDTAGDDGTNTTVESLDEASDDWEEAIRQSKEMVGVTTVEMVEWDSEIDGVVK